MAPEASNPCESLHKASGVVAQGWHQEAIELGFTVPSNASEVEHSLAQQKAFVGEAYRPEYVYTKVRTGGGGVVTRHSPPRPQLFKSLLPGKAGAYPGLQFGPLESGFAFDSTNVIKVQVAERFAGFRRYYVTMLDHTGGPRARVGAPLPEA